MAKIKVVSDLAEAEIYDAATSDDEVRRVYECYICGTIDSDRGHFGDTVEAASIHVESCGQ